MDNIGIVSLKPEDWQQYRDLRLRALKEEPQAYCSTYEENAKYPDEYWKKRLTDALNNNTQWLVFATLNGSVVGMVGAFVEKEPNNAHVIAVYVAPEARSKGISRLLMQELLMRIKTNKLIQQVTVDVNAQQKIAFNLYKKSGFKIIKKYNMILGDGKEYDMYQLQMNVNEA